MGRGWLLLVLFAGCVNVGELADPPRTVDDACGDQVLSEGESDIDCGGSSCDRCAIDRACVGNADCASGRCDGGFCHYSTSCLAIKQNVPEAESGLYLIDIDGRDGEQAVAPTYCEMQIAGGGWELVSVVLGTSASQTIVGDGVCTALQECAGHLRPEVVGRASEILVASLDGATWLLYDKFSGGSASALHYFTRNLELSTGSSCQAYDHVCDNTSRDPDLRVRETSGFVMAEAGNLRQWWLRGGWWVGAVPNPDQPRGRIHATGYNATNDIRSRASDNADTVSVYDGAQALYHRNSER